MFFLDMTIPAVINESRWCKVGEEGVEWCRVSERGELSIIDSAADLITRWMAKGG